ncbi:MAG TPA: DnaA/Hda family protein [Kiloniellales bacterium]|nr:DnaA/Hda family protein [Kiloniellales bacterium]
MGARQLVIGLPSLRRLGRADFLPAAANEAALAFVDAWPAWSGPALVIHGPEGSGKSHLAAIWRARATPLVLAPGALADQPARALLGGAQAVLLEDLDRALAERAAIEDALFSLWTALAERRGHLLLTARLPPARWTVRLPDLASRLRGAAAVAVAAPDEDLLAGLLLKLLNDRQVRIAPEVVRYLLPRIERSFGAVHRLAEALDRAALAEHREITVPLAKAVLQQISG